MFRDVVNNALEGFQRSAVATELDERDLQIRRLRQEVRAIEGVARELMVELAALRQEVAELKERGVAAPAPVSVEQPAAPAEAAPSSASTPEPEAAEAAQTSFAALAAMAASGGLDEVRHADQSSTDLEGYRERMRANGREVELAGEGLNVAADGGQFWGPVDNESSRAKAEGQVLTIDQWECISCGTCVEQTADVFVLPDEMKAEVIKQDGAMDLIQDAIDACPVTCINWVDEVEVEDFHSAGGFKDSSLNTQA